MSDEITAKTVISNGLWHNNPAIVQVLGLCPLLAVSSTIVNSIGLGLATMLVLVGSNVFVSLFRKQVPDAVRLPVFVMIIAAFVTCAELLMKAYTYELFQILGIFIPLIVTNCMILGRAEAFASKQPVGIAALDGLMMGLGFGVILFVVGFIRELLGQGTLFADMHLLLGDFGLGWKIQLMPDTYSFLLFVLPPGAFLVVGMLIAVKNSIDIRNKKRAAMNKHAVAKGSKRVRTTEVLS